MSPRKVQGDSISPCSREIVHSPLWSIPFVKFTVSMIIVHQNGFYPGTHEKVVFSIEEKKNKKK
jgi:hypothetical protein